MTVTINETRLCGPAKFVVWNNTEDDFGKCFQNLVLIFPTQVLLGVVSSYYLGFQATQWFLRTRFQKQMLLCRSLVILILTIIPICRSIALYTLDRDSILAEGEAGVLSGAVECLCWSLHLMYSYLLYHRISLSIRGPSPVIWAWFLCLAVTIIECRTAIRNSKPLLTQTDKVIFTSAVASLISQFIYLLTLIPSGDQRSSHYEELNRETEPLLTDVGFSQSYRRQMLVSTPNYGGFVEDSDPYYLGVAKDSAKVNWLNKLFFVWVNPLISKGRRGNLHTSDDVYDLPDTLTVHNINSMFKARWDKEEKLKPGNVKLFRILRNCYGKEFLGIGGLKFLNDCSGFAGPILLNLVVTFVETKQENVARGYLYAFLLGASTFLAAMCSCHFNLFMTELGMKVRGAVTSLVYKKVVSVSKVNLADFTSGQIINLMSVDVDRVVNFSPSLHAAWSLPFQFSVTLALLYQQVGISFLVGLVFTLMVLPVNKIIANKIGDLSTRMMTAKDERVNVMAELLSGIRVIKYFNWEKFFAAKVNDKRTQELKYLKGRKYADAVCVYLWATAPVLMSVLTFVTFVLLGNSLTAAKVFTSVALFSMLTGPLNAFPWVLNGLVESLVSLKRLDAFLALQEFNPDDYFSRMYDIADVRQERNNRIVIVNGNFSHEKSALPLSFKLNGLNLSVLDGELIGVTGSVGAGKSSLLQAILGEMEPRGDGSIAVDKPQDGIGFVSQEPWLQEGNIRDNILFGTAYQHTWYSKVTEACALIEDFKTLSKGDMTSVGEKGSKLSGGQKARIALARAVYQNKELYLIDDIFSAVDSHVASHIYRKCILGLLQKKTRILCTHQTRYLSGADTVLHIKDGHIKHQGPASLILNKISTKISRNDPGNFSMLGTPGDTGRSSPTHLRDVEDFLGLDKSGLDMAGSVEEEVVETMEQGTVKLRVYKKYWRAVGSFLSPLILLSLLAMQVTRNLTDVWLAHWVTQDEGNSTKPNISYFSEADPGSRIDPSIKYYLTVYGTIAAGNSFFSLVRAFLFAYGGVSAAKTIHVKLLRVILRAKTSFFDNNSAGRILNRFSSDLYTVDDSLPFILNIFLANLFGVLGPLLVTIYAVPWILLVLVPLSASYYTIQQQYRPASRDLKRIGSVTMSPMYSHFSETLVGVSTIRAMNQVHRFSRENEERLEASLKASYAGQAASQWLELRLQLIGVGMVAGVAGVAVLQHHFSVANPGLVGLAISYSLGITGKLSGLVSSFTETERELVSVERCVQYMENVPSEKLAGSITSPYGWPSDGVVSLKNVFMRYQPHLPRALKGVTLTTKAAEKVGIVGRTGSGKSSLFQALMRVCELESGEIYIDNVNIAHLDLHELRQHLVIIPQQPFLFSGTVRENLDPDEFYSDRQLAEALKRSKLDRVIARLGGLEFAITGEGTCFSAGQKQLMCLARAVLSPARVVLIDEATANVDSDTDQQIQQVIQTCLADRTILTIAHRVNTVLSCDRVFILEDGGVVESGHPALLLQDDSSRFSKFVASR